MKAAAQASTGEGFRLFPVIECWNTLSKPAIIDVVTSWNPDLIHFEFPTQGVLGARLPWQLPLYFHLLGIPVVQTWHELGLLTHPFKFMHFILSHGMPTLALVPGEVIVVRRDYADLIRAFLRPLLVNKSIRFIPNASAVPSVQIRSAERSAIRSTYARSNAQLVVFFGFLHESKRIELLFEIADPDTTHIVIVGGSFRLQDCASPTWALRNMVSEYERKLRSIAEAQPWKGKVTFAGFLPVEEAARVIACADAVVMPFQSGEWNTSLHAAQAQGTFALTTSRTQQGYNVKLNTYYANPGDVVELKRALTQYIGVRSEDPRRASTAWDAISVAHVDLYTNVAERPKTRRSRILKLLARALWRIV